MTVSRVVQTYQFPYTEYSGMSRIEAELSFSQYISIINNFPIHD